jgi:hypothetical protein
MFVVRLFGKTWYLRVPRGEPVPRPALIAGLTAVGTMVALTPAMLLTTTASAHAHAAAHPRVPAITRHLSPDSGLAVHHDTSLPLRVMARHAKPPRPGQQIVHRLLRLPHPPASSRPDPAVQRHVGIRPAIATTNNFDGISDTSTGNPCGCAPPDPNAAAGTTQVVEIVNTAFAVYSKTGGTIMGPTANNTLWSGFGGDCQTSNDGDATVAFDKLADRWVIQQFANVTSSTGPFFECVAVSTSADATGTYNRYSFQFTTFPDYPKLSVWPDAYYTTYNMFNAGGSTFLDGEVCAMDRANMLTGAAATQQCFTTDASHGGLLAADLDGTTAPPTGEPETVMGIGTTSTTLDYWHFHVDFGNPANSTFTGPSALTVASYSTACGGGTCIPQGGTTQQLDSLGDRVMYRLAYRNFGDHESLVLDQSVTAGSSTGMRWYEFRLSGGNPTVFQQGTYAPDSTFRWMGSIAMDHVGNIAMGYSDSSSSAHPGIRFTGRLAGDPLGTMTQAETTVITGGGSQTGSLSRWGDYTSMAVDPADDCTFWYTDEYIPSNGSFNWNTRLASFQLPGCSTPTNDFSMSASPASGTVTAGGSTTATVSTATTSGTAQTVNLSATGLPSGATASFNPASVTSGNSSTATFATSSSTPAGSYPITITGTGTSATHSVTYTLTVNAANDFSISISPTSGTVTAGGSTTATVSTATTSGTAQTVNLSATGLPSGATASFNPASVTSGNSSTATFATSSSTPAGTYSVTVTGTGSSATHSVAYSLTVNAAGGGGITNGGFEAGNLSGWTASGSASVTTSGPHSGTYAALLGVAGGETNGDSSIAQTFTVPSGDSTLAFWYNVSCNDSVTYDWASATLKDNTANTTSTPLGHTCVSNSGWTQVSAPVTAGHSYTLALTNHDDNFSPPDPTSTKYDDVTLSAGGGAPNPIVNGGFETGNLSGWTASGSASATTSGPHSGTYAALLGVANGETNGDSSIAQTFTAATGDSTLTFWYNVSCNDSVTYDWATATLKDNTANTTATPLAHTCVANSGWTKVTASVTAGHSYTLTLTNHDDNFSPPDPTSTEYDDVVVS